MKKIYLILSIIGMLIFNSNAQQSFYKAPAGTATSSARAPNGTSAHTALKGCFLVTASELTGIATVTAINGFGFNLSRGTASTAVTGTMQVYFQNTSDITYQKGNNWTAAITGMSSVYNSTVTVPVSNTPTVMNVLLPSNFTYTGGGIYVAYEWQTSGPFETSMNIAAYESEINMNPGGATSNATVFPSSTTLGLTNFRPNFNFGFINTWTNEASIQHVVGHGKIPLTMNSPYSFSVVVKNNATLTMTNVTVNMEMSGANTFSNTTIIPSIAAGGTTFVSLTPFTPTAHGLSTITVSLLPDENNFNNVGTPITQSVTCDVLALGPLSVTPVTYSTGVGFQTGSGSILNRIRPTINASIVAVDIAISSDNSNIGKPLFGIMTTSTGVLMGTTNTFVITAQDLNKFKRFFFPNPIPVLGNGVYHVGLSQPTFPQFPLGSTPASFVPPNTYYQSGVTGGFAIALNQNLGKFGIEAIYDNGIPLTVNSGTICSGNSLTLTASGAPTYSWTTGATTNSIIVSPNTPTTYVVTGYSLNCSAQKLASVHVNITPTISVPNGGICPSPGSHTFVPSGGASTYTYSSGSNIVTPSVTTVYTVVGTSSAGCISNVVTPTVFVQNAATVSIIGPTSICTGKSATLEATGAVSYTWSTSETTSSIVVSPTVANTYAVLGALGTCTSYVTTLITINPNPTITAVSTASTYCLGGDPVLLTASGAQTYTWSNGPNTATYAVTPTVVTTYSVGAHDANGCYGSKLILIAVNPSPTISAVTSNTTICINGSATLTATGANNYVWSNNTSTTNVAIVSPTATTVYTVTGYALSGCSDTYTLTQIVDPCAGVKEIDGKLIETKIYPNPNSGLFNVSVSSFSEKTSIEVYNQLGQQVYNALIQSEFSKVDMSDLPNGVYMLRVKEGNQVLESLRIIKQ
jgi:hypothetical protein